MLGLTGASGAPYAARVLRALGEAGAAIGVVASRAGRQVIALGSARHIFEALFLYLLIDPIWHDQLLSRACADAQPVDSTLT